MEALAGFLLGGHELAVVRPVLGEGPLVVRVLRLGPAPLSLLVPLGDDGSAPGGPVFGLGDLPGELVEVRGRGVEFGLGRGLGRLFGSGWKSPVQGSASRWIVSPRQRSGWSRG